MSLSNLLSDLAQDNHLIVPAAIICVMSFLAYIFKTAFEDYYKGLDKFGKIAVLTVASFLLLGITIGLIALYIFCLM
ncbi:MAG: hypothetical protein ACLUFN_07670 [Eubacterium sp.]